MQISEADSWTFTGTGAGTIFKRAFGAQTYQATVVGSGAVSATVAIEARNSASSGWITLGTLSPTGTNSADDWIHPDTPWLEHRANCTALSGGATVTINTVGGQ